MAAKTAAAADAVNDGFEVSDQQWQHGCVGLQNDFDLLLHTTQHNCCVRTVDDCMPHARRQPSSSASGKE